MLYHIACAVHDVHLYMLTIKETELQKIIEHCHLEYPNEACGILAGSKCIVELAIKMTNTDSSPSSYAMDPQEQLRVVKNMRQAGLELVGIYHSHTGSEAYPSSTDVRLAYYPDTAYVIVTLLDRSCPVVKGYRIKNDSVKELPMNIVVEER